MAQTAVDADAGRRPRSLGPMALSGIQSGKVEEAPCAGLTGSSLQALRRAGHPGGTLRSEVGGQLVAGLRI